MFSAKQNHDKMVAKKIAEEERAKVNAEVEYYGAHFCKKTQKSAFF